MKKLLVLVFCSILLFSCGNSGKRRWEMTSSLRESYELSCDSTVTDMKIVYEDRNIQIRTYKLDGHDRILVRSLGDGHAIDDDHSENCKKCYEDPYN